MKRIALILTGLRPAPDAESKIKTIYIKLIVAMAAGGLALVAAALIVLPARATPQSGVTSVTLAHGILDEVDIMAKTDMDPGPATDFWKAMISTKGVSHLFVVQNTVTPG